LPGHSRPDTDWLFWVRRENAEEAPFVWPARRPEAPEGSDGDGSSGATAGLALGSMTILDPWARLATAPPEPVVHFRGEALLRGVARHGARLVRQIPAGRLLAIVLLALLLPVGFSYGRALTKPGTDSVGIRSVEWIKDHGGRGLVAWIEKVWYTHHAPKKGGTPKASSLPAFGGASAAASFPPYDTPTPVHLLASPPLPGEGLWQPGGRVARDPRGGPTVFSTFMRPDPVHTSLVTGLAWMDPKRVRFALYSGNEEPAGSWSQMAPIPESVRPDLVAAFNSGFKLNDSHGGYYAEGRLARPLRDGKASFVIFDDGTATVGEWGRDVELTPDVVAVRQNLLLLVDGGQPAPNLDQDSLARWGFTPGNGTLVWRSGVGVDTEGHIIYVAGNGLSVRSLANVFVAAGAVRAMELDINSAWADYFIYQDDPSVPGGTSGTKLIPDMRPSPERYFRPSSRDFFVVFNR